MRGTIILDDVVSWRRIPLWLAFANPEPPVLTTCAPEGQEAVEAVLRLADSFRDFPIPDSGTNPIEADFGQAYPPDWPHMENCELKANP